MFPYYSQQTGNSKKTRGKGDAVSVDDVFMPKDETEFDENGDEFELELNEFKRCIANYM